MSSDGPTRTSIAPWLAVSDATKAVEYYKNALDATEDYRLEGDDGEVLVAQLSVDGAEFWVQDDLDLSPTSRGESSVRMILTVDDPDTLFEQAIGAGATQMTPMTEEHGWRTGRVVDPFGHHWEFAKPVED